MSDEKTAHLLRRDTYRLRGISAAHACSIDAVYPCKRLPEIFLQNCSPSTCKKPAIRSIFFWPESLQDFGLKAFKMGLPVHHA